MMQAKSMEESGGCSRVLCDTTPQRGRQNWQHYLPYATNCAHKQHFLRTPRNRGQITAGTAGANTVRTWPPL